MITFQHSTRRTVAVAVLIPLITAAVQYVLWPYMQPFAWLLFYPAVLLAAWVGGRRAGLLASLLSAGLVIYIFVPPMFSLQLDKPGSLFGAAIFIVMGYLFSLIFDRWRRATARADVLEQLQASEARYAELVQHANSAIFRWRVDGTIVFANEYAQQLFGYTAAQLIGQPVSLMLPPHDSTGADLSTLVQDIAAHPENFKQNVNENVCRDGRRIWLAWTNTPVRDDHGQVTEILAVGTDITARKQAEEALQISQARLSFALEKSHTGGWDLDLIDHTAVRTLEHDRIFGYDTLLPRWTYEMFLEHVLEDDRAEVNRLFQAAVTAGGDWDFECRIRRVDGEIRWIRANGGHQPGEHRAPRRMAGIVQDITQRKQADEALRASENGLKRAEAAAHIGHWTWDVCANRVAWSDEMYRIFGLNPIGFSGDLDEVIRTVIHPDDRAKLAAANAAVSEAAQPAPLDYRVVWPDGTVRVVHAAPAEATRDDQGRVVRLFGTVQDITDRAQAERRVKYLSRLYATLSQVNQAIVRTTDRETLFNAICRVAIDFGEFKLAWIGLGDLVTGQITLAAQYGQSDVHLPIEPFNLNEEPFRLGVMGRAITGGQVEIVNNVQNDPRMAHWHDFARQNNYQSSAAIPIRQRGRVIGALNLYATDVDFFAVEDERNLLVEMGLDISFALDALQLEAERLQAEEALRQSEERYRMAQTIGHVGNWEYNLQTAEFWGSPEAKLIYGFDPEQAAFSTDEVESCIPERERVHQALIDLIESDKPYNLEFEIIPKNLAGPKVITSIAQLRRDEQGRPLLVTGVVQDITERWRAEEALRQSEERYRQLFENMTEGFFQAELIVDETGQAVDFRFLDVNPAHERIIGLKRDQVIGKTASELFPNLEASWYAALAQVVHTGEPLYAEGYVSATGRYYANSYFSPSPGQFASVFSDITERKQAEEANRRQREQLATVVEIESALAASLDQTAICAALQRGVSQLFPEAGTILVSDFDAAHELIRPAYGYHDGEPVDVTKLPAIPLAPPGQGNQSRVIHSRQPLIIGDDLEHQLRPGTVVPLGTNDGIDTRSALYVPMLAQDQVLGVVQVQSYLPQRFTAEDARALTLVANTAAASLQNARLYDLAQREIVEREQRERDLQAVAEVSAALRAASTSEDMLAVVVNLAQRLFKATAASIAFDLPHDGQVLVVHASGQWQPLTGLRVPRDHSITGQVAATGQAYVNDDIRTDPRLPAHELINGAHAIACVPLTEQVGTIGVLTVGRATPMTPGEVRVLQAIADIAANALHRASIVENLEQLVVERTRNLAEANTSLAQAVEQLTELDRLKSKFVSDVSHELRTPITSLSLYIDLLEHGKPEKRERYVTGLKEQMARLHKLINDILDLSRLERDEGGRSLVDLNSIAEHVTAMERGSAEAAGLTLTCEVAENLPPVVARPDQLTRALTNLVSNAIKYTAAGSVRVQTRLDQQRICLEVRDTGRGIPADELPHVFERFYRGKGVSQSTIPGTGLGLSIVKEIIESHGGLVDVRSQLGQGSTFFIWLPVA